MDHIETLYSQIDQMMDLGGRDPEVKEWVNRKLRANRGLIELVSRDGGYQDFVLSYIQSEREKFHATLEHPSGETRDKRLCTCTWDCELKRGDEPAEFRKHDDLDAGIRAFKRNHDGRPIVLDEAREAWGEQVGEVETLLRRLVTAMSNNCIPEWADDDDLRHLLEERRRAEQADAEDEGEGEEVAAD